MAGHASVSPLDGLDVAAKLNSVAIHLLRRLRRQDLSSGLSAARLSALSVLVFDGPKTVSELAGIEQVRLPTISRLVASLEQEGHVVREPDVSDGRVARLRATEAGQRVMEEARLRRIRYLAGQLTRLPPEDLAILDRATVILEHLPEQR